MADSIETIYDALRKAFAAPDAAGKPVRTFALAEIPESVTAEMIPCAITYPTDVQVQYSRGGPTILRWSGQTDYHLTKDVKPANITLILPYFGRILAKVALHLELADRAQMSLVQETSQAMTFITYKNSTGDKDDHQGIVARWEIIQSVSGQYTIG